MERFRCNHGRDHLRLTGHDSLCWQKSVSGVYRGAGQVVKNAAATDRGKVLVHRNGKKWRRRGTRRLRWSVLATIAMLGGCAGLSPPSDNAGGGINLDYLFGVRRPAEQVDVSLIDDPEYTEYLEWKRWQDFKAYQEWKRRRDEQGILGDAVSN